MWFLLILWTDNFCIDHTTYTYTHRTHRHTHVRRGRLSLWPYTVDTELMTSHQSILIMIFVMDPQTAVANGVYLTNGKCSSSAIRFKQFNAHIQNSRPNKTGWQLPCIVDEPPTTVHLSIARRTSHTVTVLLKSNSQSNFIHNSIYHKLHYE